jgi:hypothetical protein
MDSSQIPSPGEIDRAEYPHGHKARVLIVSLGYVFDADYEST